MIEFQADEAGFPGFEDFFQTPGCLNAERAFERKQQEMLVAALAENFVEAGGE